MRVLDRILGLPSLATMMEIAKRQQELIAHQTEMLAVAEDTIVQLRLEHARSVRDLVEQFFLAQMSGTDVTEDLEAGLNDMRDFVAQLEEHTG